MHAGNANDVCVEEADARLDASEAKRDADYQVAVEKCDALAGDCDGQLPECRQGVIGQELKPFTPFELRAR